MSSFLSKALAATADPKKRIFIFVPFFIVLSIASIYLIFGREEKQLDTKKDKEVAKTAFNKTLPDPVKTELITTKLDDYSKGEIVPMGNNSSDKLSIFNRNGNENKSTAFNTNLDGSANPNPSISPLQQKVKEDSAQQSRKNIYDAKVREIILAKMQDGTYNPNGQSNRKPVEVKRLEDKLAQLENKMKRDSSLQMAKQLEQSSVRIQNTDVVTSYLSNDKSSATNKNSNSFYSIGVRKSARISNSIPAVVHGNQTIINGSTVKLRLLSNMMIGNDVVVPKNSFIYGTATVSGERVGLRISSINVEENIYPVKLSLFDEDGIAGIYVPDMLERNELKGSTSQTIESSPTTIQSGTAGGIAAQQGINLGKSVLSKKVSLVKVNLKANYKVLLRPDEI